MLEIDAKMEKYKTSDPHSIYSQKIRRKQKNGTTQTVPLSFLDGSYRS